MKVAVLGTGTIGSAVGAALLQSGYEVIAYNRTSSKTEELVKKGAAAANHPAEAIEEADAVLLTVMDGSAVKELLFSKENRELLAGKNILNIATTSSDEIKEIAKQVDDLGGTMSELAIKTDAAAVRERNTYALLACEPELKLFWKEMFDSVGETVYVGQLGAASDAVTLGIMGSAFSSLYLAYSVAFALKMDLPQQVVERDVSQMVPFAKDVLPLLYKRDYSQGFATLDGYRDTVKIGIETLKKAGLPTQVFDEIISLYESAGKKGFGDKGESSLMEALLDS